MAPTLRARHPRFLVARAQPRFRQSDRPVHVRRLRRGRVCFVHARQRFLFLGRDGISSGGSVLVLLRSEAEQRVPETFLHCFSFILTGRRLTAFVSYRREFTSWSRGLFQVGDRSGKRSAG